MIKVHGRPDSSNSAKVFWALDEIGMPFELAQRGGRFGGNLDPDYLRMNPTGKVPTLEDGGVVVRESNAIIRYLGSRSGMESLWPSSPAGRAVIDQWMDWAATSLVPAMGKFRKAKTDPASAAKALEELARPIGLMDAALADRDFLAGNHFTLADIAVGPAVLRWSRIESQKPEFPKLATYLERLYARPAFVERLAKTLS